MKRLLALLLFAVPLSAATISGTVTDAGTHAALPSMTVQAYDASGVLKGSATTDAAGHYSLTLNGGAYHVLAFDPAGTYATNFYADAESFESSALLTLSTSLTNINFALVRGGTIAGTVTSTSGSPLSAITVAAYNADGTRRGFTTTDASGHYQLVVPPGSFLVAAYDDALAYLPLVSPAAMQVDAGTTSRVDFHLTRGALISGTITDALTGAPIANANVAVYVNEAQLATVMTDAAGHYRLLIAPATVRVLAFDPTGVYATTFAPNAESFDTSTRYTLAAADALTLNLQLIRGGRIAGHVTDAGDGTPLASMTVAAYNADGTTRAFTTTDANGAYTLVVPPGGYRIGAYDPNNLVYLARFAPITESVFASQTTTADIALPRGAVISGQVTNASLATLAGITVGAYDAHGLVTSATTDAVGHFRLLLEPGAYTLATFDPLFHYATSYLATSAPASADFTLVTGAHVSGVVITSRGVPVDAMTVNAYDTNGAAVATTTSRADGSFDFVLPPGTYRFAAFDPQLRFAASALTLSIALSATQTFANVTLELTSVDSMRRRSARH